MRLLEHFRMQARACASMGSPMYAELLTRCRQDLEEGGPVAQLLEGYEALPGDSALALRMLGSVHGLVLERRAGELAAYYPSVGGTWSIAGGWEAFARLVAEEPATVREWLDRPPQTNEVGRSAALYGGLLHLSRDLPVRLLEIGCSGGLNLRADRFGYLDETGRRYGPADADLVIEDAWHGRPLEPWPDLDVVMRRGCDVDPVDPRTTQGRLTLTAYVWPDQVHRLERLRAAFEVADAVPAEVVKQDACSFLDDAELTDGTTTVVWHSVMWQYLTREDRARASERLEALGALASPSKRFAHLRSEPTDASAVDVRFLIHLTEWPGGEERLLGETVGHGVPTRWLLA